MKKRFEKGRTYWEVEVVGNVLHTRSSVGDDRKAFATPKQAEAEAEKRIWDKRALGYVEAGASPVVASTPSAKAAPLKAPEPAVEPPMKTVIGRLPEDMVFTYLLAGNDLITIVGKQRVTQSFDTPDDAKSHLSRVLSLRTRDGYRITERAPATEEELKEPLAEDKTVEVRPNERGIWQLTFRTTDEVSPSACAFAIAEMQRGLPRVVHVRCDLASPGARWSEALQGKTFPSVERFAFDTEFQTVTRQSSNGLGDLSATFAALPNLKHAFFTGDFTCSKSIASPQLETLVLQGNPLSPVVVQALVDAALPKLESLAIGLSSDAEPLCTDAWVAHAVSHTSAREVFVDGVRDIAAFLRLLTEKPLPSSLRRLLLEGGSATNEDDLLEALEAHASAFANITVAMPIENLLTEEAEERLRTRIPTLTDLDDARERLLPQAYLSWGEV